jgi:hypothetical protein
LMRTGGIAVHNDEPFLHRARLCPQGPQARQPVYKKIKPGSPTPANLAYVSSRSRRLPPVPKGMNESGDSQFQ